jgi:hypothetical protein
MSFHLHTLQNIVVIGWLFVALVALVKTGIDLVRDI